MQIFLVGGALRDELLGLPVKDRDYVVVGATPQAMLDAGYRPVGKDFPVFLHPETQEEYALARTERKTAPGYAGFAFHAAPDVTLEQDLLRRDLTINAMARGEDGVLVDPFNGQADLQQHILRHVSAAFSEDPVRILRLARFAARFTAFDVAPETLDLMQQMVDSGEADALVAERIWQEVSRGLMAAKPSRMLEMLHRSRALSRIWPDLNQVWDQESGQIGVRLDQAAAAGATLPIRFATLAGALYLAARADKALQTWCESWRVPAELRDLARLVVRHGAQAYDALNASPDVMVDWMTQCDVWRKPDRFQAFLQVLEFLSLPGMVLPRAYLQSLVDAARAVDAGAVAHQIMQQPAYQAAQIPAAVRAARKQAIMAVMAATDGAAR